MVLIRNTESQPLKNNDASKFSSDIFSKNADTCVIYAKLLELYFNTLYFSKCMEKVLKRFVPMLSCIFLTVSLPWEKIYALKWSSDSFPYMLTHMVFMEISQIYISTYSPIVLQLQGEGPKKY